MKKIKITDEEKEMFNALWEMREHEKTLGIENFPKPPKEMVDEFVHYLSLKYKFNPNSFTVYDKKGKLIHSRMEKPKEFVN